ncbi:MAG: serine hydrolase domain-containing protein [Acidimicrobiia bacterium]|nr:serine hydrolase domain-containing protein [Acidimicrobiia bacterium]
MTGLAESVRRVASESGFSGVVRVDTGDAGPEFAEAFGFAHRGFRIRNGIDTQFAIASGGKGFTALAIVSLIVDGVLSLDTTARSLLGEDLPLVADDVTVEHLLGHRSGIGDYLDEEVEDMDLSAYVLRSPVQDLATTEAFVAELDGFPTKFTAGDRFSYSNGGYVLLALIAERAGGIPYHNLVESRVLDPAGVTDTGFLRSDEPSGRMALGYVDGESLRTNVLHLPVRGNGDGGIYTTAADLHVFWRALFDGRIVPTEWVIEMTRPHSVIPAGSDRYGLGFWLAEDSPNTILIGGDTGVSFCSNHDPTTGTTWTVAGNTTEGAWPLIRMMPEALEAR